MTDEPLPVLVLTSLEVELQQPTHPPLHDAAVLAALLETTPDGLHRGHERGVHGVHHMVRVALQQTHHRGDLRVGLTGLVTADELDESVPRRSGGCVVVVSRVLSGVLSAVVGVLISSAELLPTSRPLLELLLQLAERLGQSIPGGVCHLQGRGGERADQAQQVLRQPGGGRELDAVGLLMQADPEAEVLGLQVELLPDHHHIGRHQHEASAIWREGIELPQDVGREETQDRPQLGARDGRADCLSGPGPDHLRPPGHDLLQGRGEHPSEGASVGPRPGGTVHDQCSGALAVELSGGRQSGDAVDVTHRVRGGTTQRGDLLGRLTGPHPRAGRDERGGGLLGDIPTDEHVGAGLGCGVLGVGVLHGSITPQVPERPLVVSRSSSSAQGTKRSMLRCSSASAASRSSHPSIFTHLPGSRSL